MGMPDVVVGSTDVVEAEAEDEERSDSLKGNIPLFDGAVVVSAVAVTKDNLHEKFSRNCFILRHFYQP